MASDTERVVPTYQEILRNKPLMRVVVAKLVPVSQFFEANRKMQVCPFHKDDTPSARIYSDPECERLFCYACFPGWVQVNVDKKRTLSIGGLVKAFKEGNEVWVLTSEGPKVVQDAFSVGDRELYCVEHEHGELEVTAEHPIAVLVNGEVVYKRVDSLQPGDQLVTLACEKEINELCG